MKGLTTLLMLGFLFFGFGCKSSDTTEIQQGISKTYKSAKDAVSGLTSDGSEMASEEVAKLFIYEYKVIEFDKLLPPSELELSLTLLGRERWDCFHVEPMETTLKFFCKRRPKTYLRYIPRVF